MQAEVFLKLCLSSNVRCTTNFGSSRESPDYCTNSELEQPPKWIAMSMPGAFPDATEEENVPAQRTPRRRFVGRKTLEARQKQGDGSSVEETTAIVQSGESITVRREPF